MKDQIKRQVGFIQIPVLIVFIGVLIAIGIVGNSGYQNYQLKKVKEVQEKQIREKTNTDLQAAEIEKLKNEVGQLKNRPAPLINTTKQTAPIDLEKYKLKAQKQTPPLPVDVAPPNTIACNGKNWLPCPTGQQFYCPPVGDAQCTEERKQATINTGMSAQQKCLTEGLNTLTDASNKRLKEIEDSLGGYVSAKQRALDDLLSWYSDSLYRIQLWCGTVSTEGQMIHELQKIRESLDKLGT